MSTHPVRAFVHTHFGGLPRPFWLVFSGQLVNRVGGMVLPFLVFFLDGEGLNAAAAGTVVAALGLGHLVGPAIGGMLADRVGRRVTLVSAMVGTALSLTALSAVNSFAMLTAMAVLLGLFASAARPAISALAADHVDPSHRARAFGLLYWAINIGAAIAGVTAALLVPIGFWLLFLVDGLTCLAFAVIVYVGLPRDRPQHGRQSGGIGYSVVFRDKLLIGIALLVMAQAIVFIQMEFGLPLALRDNGLPAAAFGLLYTLNATLVVLCQPVLNTWLSRFRRLHVLAGAWLTIGIGMALTGLADTAWQFAATVVVWTFGEMAGASFAGALVADLAPDGAQGRYQATLGWAFGTAKFIGPILAGFVYSTYGPASLWWGCLALGSAAALGGVALAPAAQRRQASAQAERDAALAAA